MNAVKQVRQDKTKVFFRVAYVLFVLLAIYYSIKGETGNAASNLGIGLIFDPFAPARWEERKVWQKAWLLVHVTVVLCLFAATIFWN